MTDSISINKRLADLEEAINAAERTTTTVEAQLPAAKSVMALPGNKYLYMIGVLIPLVAAAALYLANPKFVQKKKEKGVRDVKQILKWVAIISIIGWILLAGLGYSGVIKA